MENKSSSIPDVKDNVYISKIIWEKYRLVIGTF